MNPSMILDVMAELGIQLSVRGDRLVVSTSQEAIDEELLEFLRGHKASLVSELLTREARSSAAGESPSVLRSGWHPDPELDGCWICCDVHGLAMAWQNYAPGDPPCEGE